VQTAALAVADLAYPRANLEHAAASAANMMQAILLIFLLTLALTAIPSPDVTLGHVHPVTLLLFPAAAASFWLAYRTWEKPMWKPTQTGETVEDLPAPGHEEENLTWLFSALILTAAMTGVAGAVIAESAQNLVEETDLSPAVVGGLFMALATSLPELVTSIAAVRRGALTLAVSDIVGGNFFDVLFVAAADVAYLKGSLYHQPDIGASDLFMTAVTILMNVTLLMGLIHRQKKGPANIGFESVGILLLYAVGFTIVAVGMG
jgi:cation:H+ antiporter